MIRIALCLVCFALAGTASANPDRHLGDTVRANIAAQTIDMSPDYAGRPVPGASGRRAADAMIRYQTGKLKPLLKTNGKTELGAQGGAKDSDSATAPLVSSAPN